MANDFGKNLKIMRKLNNITQSEMARKVNASRSCISNYESGKRQPDAETINFIADFFDVSIYGGIGHLIVFRLNQLGC